MNYTINTDYSTRRVWKKDGVSSACKNYGWYNFGSKESYNKLLGTCQHDSGEAVTDEDLVRVAKNIYKHTDPGVWALTYSYTKGKQENEILYIIDTLANDACRDSVTFLGDSQE